jgi:hypothetical protein
MTLKTKLILSISILLVFGFVLTNVNNYRVSLGPFAKTSSNIPCR